MGKSDGYSKSEKFRAAVLVTSDRAHSGVRPDKAGPLLKRRLLELGYTVVFVDVVPDHERKIVEVLKKWVFNDEIRLILTSGGTGIAPKDVTPEATKSVIEKRVPGLEEEMRRPAPGKTPLAALSRGVAGIAQKSLIINLPGNPAGAMENLAAIEPILEHALKLLTGKDPH
jgi:molybdenum cofactor synthesis domain-containing protein